MSKRRLRTQTLLRENVESRCEECNGPVETVETPDGQAWESVCTRCGLVQSKPPFQDLENEEEVAEREGWRPVVPIPPPCICFQPQFKKPKSVPYNIDGMRGRKFNIRWRENRVEALCTRHGHYCAFTRIYYFSTGRWSDVHQGKIVRKRQVKTKKR
ncbi:MAG: hypothetical protein QW542_05675 [Thermoproteota archaeon]